MSELWPMGLLFHFGMPVDLFYIESNIKQNEPAHDKTYRKTYAISEDSDQPARLGSLISVFADRMCILQPLGYPKIDIDECLPYWVDVQAELSLLVLEILL